MKTGMITLTGVTFIAIMIIGIGNNIKIDRTFPRCQGCYKYDHVRNMEEHQEVRYYHEPLERFLVARAGRYHKQCYPLKDCPTCFGNGKIEKNQVVYDKHDIEHLKIKHQVERDCFERTVRDLRRSISGAHAKETPSTNGCWVGFSMSYEKKNDVWHPVNVDWCAE